MFHLVYWGDLDHNTFSSDPYNPEGGLLMLTGKWNWVNGFYKNGN